MNEHEFEDVVAEARRHLEGLLRTTDNTSFTTSGLTMSGLRRLRTNPEALLTNAALDLTDYHRLTLALSYKVETGEPLEGNERAWLAKFLRGEIEKPQSNGGRPRNTDTDVAIVSAVSWLTNLKDVPATRNDASSPYSACDAIAAALTDLGRSPRTFEGVKKIWLRHRPESVE